MYAICNNFTAFERRTTHGITRAYQGGSGSIIRNDDWSSDIEVVVEIPTADLETGRLRDRPAIEVVAGHRGRGWT